MSNHNVETNNAESNEVEIALSGWLMKRCQFTKRWKQTWFILRSSNLAYGKSENGPFKNIPLQSTAIDEAHIDGKRYVFRLRPPKSKRDYLIQAPDEQTEERWMQAICFAKVSANSSEASQTCSIQ